MCRDYFRKYGVLGALLAYSSIFTCLPSVVLSAKGRYAQPPLGRFEAGKPAIEAIRDVLVQDEWVMVLGGDRESNTFIYKFRADGHYKETLDQSDVLIHLSGTWKLTAGPENSVHLLLDSEKPLYLLPADTVIEYDAVKDQVVISGKNVVGKQPLSRRKADATK